MTISRSPSQGVRRADGAPRAGLRALLVPCPAAWMKAYPVSTAVNKTGQGGPELIARAG